MGGSTVSRTAAVFCLAVLFALPSAGVARQKQDKQIAELIEKLGDDSYETREEAQKSLEKIGEPAWDALVKAKTHKDLEVRKRARKALAAIFTGRLDRLIGDLADKAKRAAASKELAKLLAANDEKAQQAATKKALLGVVKRPKNADAKKAAEDVLQQAYAPQVKNLIAQLTDDSFQKRVDAERGLLEVGLPALAALKEAAKSEDLEKSVRAKQLIKRIEAN
jgi:HEAT repeat protein